LMEFFQLFVGRRRKFTSFLTLTDGLSLDYIVNREDYFSTLLQVLRIAVVEFPISALENIDVMNGFLTGTLSPKWNDVNG